jgi:hypothetical protein
VRRGKRTTYENAWLRFEVNNIVHPDGESSSNGQVLNSVRPAVRR